MAASTSSTGVEYPWPQTDGGANFLPQKLWFSSTNTNYQTWKAQMVSLIEGRRMLGFINGNILPPPQTIVDPSDGWTVMINPDYVMWRRTDQLVKEWILGSLYDDVVSNVAPLDTARDVWVALENAFNKLSYQFQLQCVITVAPPPMENVAAALPSLPMKMPPMYFQVYRAALRGDWEEAEAIFASTPHIPDNQQKELPNIKHAQPDALRAAIGGGKLSIDFVRKAVKYWSDESVAIVDTNGDTAVHIAAAGGNTAAATLLVQRMPSLLYVCNNDGDYPLQVAAAFSHRDVLKYLISCTRDDLADNPYAGTHGLKLLFFVIEAEFFDISLDLVDKYPNLATIKDRNVSALKTIATKKSAFSSVGRYSFWESFLSSIPLVKSSTKDKNVKYHQSLELVKCLCKNMESLIHEDPQDFYVDAIMMAARLGIPEVIEVIVETFPNAIFCVEPDSGHCIFHKAVENRCEEVFNLIYQMSDRKYFYSAVQDSNGNNLLHLGAKLAPTHKLNQVSGAALQMQREIQWYKEVERFVNPGSRSQPNKGGKTPDMIFSEEHMQLKKDGEKWMKDAANSCTISAALITTIMFAAAITVPGGNESSSGFPIFSKKRAFIVFAVADAVSLFTSTTSLLMFLAILTSRYAEEMFLYVLPKRLIIGLGTLFLSITSMMVAFSATLFLVFGRNTAWILIPVAALACLPVASFVLLQFPLLVDLISSTYGPGIFGKKSNKPFY